MGLLPTLTVAGMPAMTSGAVVVAVAGAVAAVVVAAAAAGARGGDAGGLRVALRRRLAAVNTGQVIGVVVGLTLLHLLLLRAQLGQLGPRRLGPSFALAIVVVPALAQVVAVDAGEVIRVPALAALLEALLLLAGFDRVHHHALGQPGAQLLEDADVHGDIAHHVVVLLRQEALLRTARPRGPADSPGGAGHALRRLFGVRPELAGAAGGAARGGRV